MSDMLRCPRLGKGHNFLNVTFLESGAGDNSRSLPAAIAGLMPPDVLLPQHSFCSTMTNTNQLHSPAAPGLLHPAHHL